MRRAWMGIVCAFLCACGVLALIPTPYMILAPGSAVDLRSHVHVAGYPSSRDRYFLTDVVVVQHASMLMELARYLPGVRLVRRDEVVPKDIEPDLYERLLDQEMGESQDAAAFVAERAAGFRVVRPPVHVYVAEVRSNSRALGVLRAGDMLLSVGDHVITASGDVAESMKRLSPGTDVLISFRRGTQLTYKRVRTISASPAPGSRLGIVLQPRPEKPVLPIPVRCSLENISGSSGGLMLALQIYGTLHPERKGAGLLAAGTGTIGYNGVVGPIEGAQQKVIAAQRAGLRVFLAPKQNYAEAFAAAHGDMRVIAVGSFDEALSALEKM